MGVDMKKFSWLLLLLVFIEIELIIYIVVLIGIDLGIEFGSEVFVFGDEKFFYFILDDGIFVIIWVGYCVSKL